MLEIIDSAVDAGVDVVQIREKDLPHAELLSFARDVVSVVDGRARVVVNSNFDVALELGIGLHLPETAPALTEEQGKHYSPTALVGRSTHSPNTPLDGRLDYVLFGHIYATNSKPGTQPRGLTELSKVINQSAHPVWVVGGITENNAAQVIELGARGVAVIGAILDAPDPNSATRAMRTALDRAAELLADRTRKLA